MPDLGDHDAPTWLLTMGDIRTLAFKSIRILHRCWLDRVPYDEARYLLALRKRGAPLLKHAAQNA